MYDKDTINKRLSEVVNFVATTHPSGQKRCRRGDACRITSCFLSSRWKKRLHAPHALCNGQKRCREWRSGRRFLFIMALPGWLFEVVDFVATTRRRYWQGETLRDAGECYACQIIVRLSKYRLWTPPVSKCPAVFLYSFLGKKTDACPNIPPPC